MMLSPVSACGVYSALCLPRNRIAKAEAKRPKVLSAASTTNQSRRIVAALAKTVFILNSRILAGVRYGGLARKGGEFKGHVAALQLNRYPISGLMRNRPSYGGAIQGVPYGQTEPAEQPTGLHTYNKCMSDTRRMPPSAQLGYFSRDWSAADRWISGLDQAIRTVTGVHHNHRPSPANDLAETVTTPEARQHVVGLMRINHAGEVAAQALYAGQALTARETNTRVTMQEAAREETDHLAWCQDRIHELGGRTSLLNPLWYAGSFAIGAIAGVAGDRVSLGFVAETEKQVCHHLESHLSELPKGDLRTRAVVKQMSEDEARHGKNATNAGAVELPKPIRLMMKLTAKIMTRTAYRL
jgi:ubiquinone biosynthesis monooxygenase Coq7